MEKIEPEHELDTYSIITSNEDSCDPAQIGRLTRAFVAFIHLVGM